MKIKEKPIYPEDEHQHMMSCNISKEFKLDDDYMYVTEGFLRRVGAKVIQLLAISYFQVYNRAFNNFRIVGKENYKKVKKKGKVLINNHCFPLDTTSVSTMLTKFKLLHFCTLQENFQIPVARKFLRPLGGIPIPHDPKQMKKFMKVVNDILKNGGNIHFAPEGSMWYYYPGLRTFKAGAFHFACRNKVPVLPMVFVFKPKVHRLSKKVKPNKYRVELHCLEAQYPNETLEFKEQVSDLAIRCFDVMQKCLFENYKGDPNLKFSDKKFE